ncbi:S8 family serine peptidase [Thioalkalivibrio sp. XN8]|uniref:S8 family serine peptidase n=1 Tax=Thioalkalivibrio sp. XN8 TaxID=2712863 RepID=UPI0013ED762B|nr:S8 family serine peptidase [Thioalkalivibrio sp. XN8]NGP53203.1 S8 family serine peptidase [Thioalkalivibrio sp. XN8]
MSLQLAVSKSGAVGALAALLIAGTGVGSPAQAQVDLMNFEPSPQHLVMTRGAPNRQLLTAIEGAGGEVVFQHDLGIVFVRGLSDEAAANLSVVRGVTDVQADEWFAGDTSIESEALASSQVFSPDDPAAAFFYPRQWHLQAISAEPAWAAGRTGSSDVTVAILDTGIDYEHLDLQGRVDLSRSVSFVGIDDFFTENLFPGRALIADLHFHGTHVAATAVSNGIVAAGVTSKPTLMGVKVCTFTDFSCSFAAVISGILHAVDNGADVVNLSLGGGFPKAGNGRFVGFINKVYNYARSNGATMVVAAGNAATDLDRNGNIFASYCDAPGVICVSATGPTDADSVNGPWTNVDAPAVYTNFGRSSITVAAPGGNTGGRVWAACSTTSLLISVCRTSPTFVVGVFGTSMATPHVSGLAALVVEDVGRRPGRVKSAIQQGADDLGQRGTDKFYGKGRINVSRTLGLE